MGTHPFFESDFDCLTDEKCHYAIDKKLGAGSFGEVYTCWDTNKSSRAEDDIRVIKVIHIGNGAKATPDSNGELQSTASKKAHEDAKREAKILKKLNHKHIIQFHDSFVDRDDFCIVTEFCDGGDLDELIKKRRDLDPVAPLPVNLITKWTRQLLEALEYMHSFKPKPIVHRDIKSRNVFLKNNQIKLGDMGVSRVLAETFANTFLGTPFYMSPEMIKDSKYDAKSDIWSLGCIVFEMILFRRAYQSDSLMRILWKIVEDEVPVIPAADLPDSTYRPLVNIVNKMMIKNVSERYTAAELLQEELFCYSSRESSASSRGRPSSATSRPDSGHARIPSRTEYLGETVTNLTVKARTIPYNWSSSKSSTESTNKEVEQMERVIGYIDEQDIDSASESDESGSESDSEDSNESEFDEDVMLAREILAGKSSLYRENEINEIPEDLPALGRSKPLQEPINVGGKQTKEDNIGSRIMESQEKRIYHRCINELGDVNFRHAYNYLRRVYESNQYGQVNVMEGLADLIGPGLAQKCMVVEELIMCEEQNRS